MTWTEPSEYPAVAVTDEPLDISNDDTINLTNCYVTELYLVTKDPENNQSSTTTVNQGWESRCTELYLFEKIIVIVWEEKLFSLRNEGSNIE